MGRKGSKQNKNTARTGKRQAEKKGSKVKDLDVKTAQNVRGGVRKSGSDPVGY